MHVMHKPFKADYGGDQRVNLVARLPKLRNADRGQ